MLSYYTVLLVLKPGQMIANQFENFVVVMINHGIIPSFHLLNYMYMYTVLPNKIPADIFL